MPTRSCCSLTGWARSTRRLSLCLLSDLAAPVKSDDNGEVFCKSPQRSVLVLPLNSIDFMGNFERNRSRIHCIACEASTSMTRELNCVFLRVAVHKSAAAEPNVE